MPRCALACTLLVVCPGASSVAPRRWTGPPNRSWIDGRAGSGVTLRCSSRAPPAADLCTGALIGCSISVSVRLPGCRSGSQRLVPAPRCRLFSSEVTHWRSRAAQPPGRGADYPASCGYKPGHSVLAPGACYGAHRAAALRNCHRSSPATDLSLRPRLAFGTWRGGRAPPRRARFGDSGRGRAQAQRAAWWIAFEIGE